MVHDSFNHAFSSGQLSIDQRRGILTLLPKPQKDIRFLTSWRPLSLLNTDYKILAKALANRLQNVITCLVNNDQSGYVKGRYIGQNIRTIADIIEYTTRYEQTGMIVLLDFEKAFDTVRWAFLNKTLKIMNFGQNFIKWINILYSNIQSCCINDGHITQFFSLSRGIRQGCPISALLFILVAEMLSCKMRAEENIIGINVGHVQFKITQLADDTSLFLKNDASLQYALNILDQFYTCSGLKLNKNKTEIFYLGNTNHRPNKEVYGIKICEGKFKALGIYFCRHTIEMSTLNLTDRLRKFKNTLNIWASRDLSLKGKIMIIKSLAMPQLLYTTSMLYVPDTFVEEVDKLIVKFIWSNKPSKVKKNTMIADYKDGGLKMPCFRILLNCQKVMWVKRMLLGVESSKWAAVAFKLAEISPFELKCKLSLKHLRKINIPFYEQVIKCWYEWYSTEPTIDTIGTEIMWNNQFILIDNKPVNIQYKQWIDNGIYHIGDIVKENGYFLTAEELARKYEIKVNIMLYNSITQAIPKLWCMHLKCQPPSFEDIQRLHNDINQDCIMIDGMPNSVTSLSSKRVSLMLIERIKSPPTSIEKWIEKFPFLNDNDFKQYFTLAHKAVQDTKLQSFQYKILNRILPCNESLHKMKLKLSSKCDTCKETETLEHLLYLCKETKLFWKYLVNWMDSCLNMSIKLSETDILFGIPFSNDADLRELNFIIMHAKWFIYRSKLKQENIFLMSFLTNLKYHVQIEHFIECIKITDRGIANKWDKLYFTL
jgi:hypothetical protein